MKIPKEAKLVFKGVIFDVYQWEQKMFDGSTTTFERLKRPDTAIVIAVVGDKILIQEQQQPDKEQEYISIPGGRIEEGEDPLVGAQRELLEESGYVSDDWQLWKQEQYSGKIESILYFFIARNCVYKQEPQLDGGEKITNKLTSFEEFLDLADNPLFSEKELITFILRMRLDSQKQTEFKKSLFGK